MAKKTTLNENDYELDPRKGTVSQEPAPAARPGRPGRKRTKQYEPSEIAPIGVGLTFAEGERLSEIARELGVNRHELLLWWVRKFISDYEGGYRPPTRKQTVTKLGK